MKEIVLLAEHLIDGVDYHLFQKSFIDRPGIDDIIERAEDGENKSLLIQQLQTEKA